MVAVLLDEQESCLDAANKLLITAWAKKLKDNLRHISSDHKDLHGSVSRIGRTIDKVS